MEIKEINDRQIWDKLVLSFDDYTFLQGWDWGEINKFGGEKLIRITMSDKGKLIGLVQAFSISARRGKIFFVPHGPLFKEDKFEYWEETVDYLKEKANQEKCVCLRISPWMINDDHNRKIMERLGLIKSGVVMHAEDTWLVNLKGTEEEMLSRMRKTTRNLIRRGMKDGVTIKKYQSIEKVNDLYRLQMEVVKRNNFVPFSKSYLKREMEQFFANNSAELFLGEYGGVVLGAALIVFLGKKAFYYQSGSKESKTPVNYLLQWEVIREARARGCEVYNMWGVAPEGAKNHPWAGLTVFKTGFGGELKRYLPSYDMPLSWRYRLLKLIEKVPKTWRQKIRLG